MAYAASSSLMFDPALMASFQAQQYSHAQPAAAHHQPQHTPTKSAKQQQQQQQQNDDNNGKKGRKPSVLRHHADRDASLHTKLGTSWGGSDFVAVGCF